ncbi:histidine kinase [Nocardioides sp. Soil797]|nr:histidine kinase [Nocardioides sp. Soil797]
MSSPVLAQVPSIKVKLGILVVASVAVASAVATLGAQGGVPLWLGLPVTIAVALGVTQLLASGMTAPLRQMTAAARRMATGDYSTRVTVESGDEVGELARAFNTMAEDLATVDRQRRELVANVSHELRTPLAALRAVLENLADGVAPAEPHVLRAALAQAERLSDLATDLLDLARVDAGKAPLETTHVVVADLLGQVVQEVRASGRDVQYEVRVVPPTLVVSADPQRLRQLVVNLLDNAARHSPSGDLVTVHAGERIGPPVPAEATWWLEVTDKGPGIPPADREHVFERFGTLSQAEGGGGTGLGLAIARWVTDLHGGSIAFVDPPEGNGGARVRAELPVEPARPRTSEHATSLDALPQPAKALTGESSAAPRQASGPVDAGSHPSPAVPDSLLDTLFGRLWAEHNLPGSSRALLACLGVGLLAATILPFRDLGLGTFLVLLAAGGVVLGFSANKRSPFTLACAALCVPLAATAMLRDAEWIVVLSLFTGGLLCLSGLVAGRTVASFVLAGVSWPLAGIRGLPWLGRSVRALPGGEASAAVVRTVLLSVTGVLVFGLLFASADALFAQWAGALLPDLELDSFVLRAFVTVAVGGVVLAATYVAINPPPLETVGPPAPRLGSRWEWLAPVLLINVVFVAFLVAQATAIFGGHGYLEETTGLTYADYVHQGFGQLTVATALTLVVVWAASFKARRETGADRAWLRGSLGLLCAMTLVVVASALHRMHLYQEAYGFTGLRLLVDVFEAWLGLLVLGVMAAGVRLRAGWLPRAGLLSGAVLVIGLAVINPDAWVAQQNIDRYQESGEVDWFYLRGLSDDAVPVLDTLPDDVVGCALRGRDLGSDDDWLEWNLGRARANPLLRDHDALEYDDTLCLSTQTR